MSLEPSRSSLWFFLSYSRHDRRCDAGDCIKKFHEDLNQEICRKMQIRDGLAGFFDTTGIEHGDLWPEVLSTALRNCRTFVCMYSAAYFSSEYCGKEFAAFGMRLRSSGTGPGLLHAYKLILPVLLDAPQDLPKVPSAVAEIQLFDDSYPSVYREEGLLYLLRRNSLELQDKYRDFLDTLVRKILRSADNYKLPPLQTAPDIKDLGSSFHIRPADVPAIESCKATGGSGPSFVQCFFTAGTRFELQPVKSVVDSYGDEGEFDWRPYLPQTEDDVGMLAQSVATSERFHYQHVRLSEDLVQELKSAQDRRRVVVIIVDTWTLNVPRYQNLMRQIDGYNFWNLAIMIAWNDHDSETRTCRPALQTTLRQTFIGKCRIQDPLGFIDGISSAEELKSRLSATLQRIRMRIIDICNDFRKIDFDRVIPKPEIRGPGKDVHL